MGTKRPEIIPPIAIAPGGPPELSGRTLLKGTPYTLITGYGEIKLVLNKKIPSFWIVSITPEDVMRVSERKVINTLTYLCTLYATITASLTDANTWG